MHYSKLNVPKRVQKLSLCTSRKNCLKQKEECSIKKVDLSSSFLLQDYYIGRQEHKKKRAHKLKYVEKYSFVFSNRRHLFFRITQSNNCELKNIPSCNKKILKCNEDNCCKISLKSVASVGKINQSFLHAKRTFCVRKRTFAKEKNVLRGKRTSRVEKPQLRRFALRKKAVNQ